MSDLVKRLRDAAPVEPEHSDWCNVTLGNGLLCDCPLLHAVAADRISTLEAEKAQNYPGSCGNHCEACARLDDRIATLEASLASESKRCADLIEGFQVASSAASEKIVSLENTMRIAAIELDNGEDRLVISKMLMAEAGPPPTA